MDRIIAFANQKGGVGKTTTVVNLASAFAEQHKRVLVIDMDPQGNATTNVDIAKEQIEHSMFNVLVEHYPIQDAIIKKNAQGQQLPWDLVAATTDLAGAEILLSRQENPQFSLKNTLQNVRNLYDYILIDNPPALSLLTINAFTAADSVLIPVQAEFYALEGIAQLLDTIALVKENYNPPLSIEGFLMTMTSPMQRLSREVTKDVRDHFGNRVYQTEITRNVRIAEAPSYGQSVIDYDPRSKGAKLYTKLAEEILERHGQSN